ncbi:phage tail tape measure protein [Xanthobacter agilis]|uniref:phage tail tape measure protein n=1 Tax=Xanthobacter agilis TaxID=47492 RepID=UPI00372D3395
MTETVDIAVAVDTREAKAALGEMEVSAKGLAGTLGSAFTGLAVQGRDLGTVLEQLGVKLSNMALTAALKPLESSFSTLLSSVTSGLGFSKGGVFAGGAVQPFAKGGVIGPGGGGGAASGSGGLVVRHLVQGGTLLPFAKGGVIGPGGGGASSGFGGLALGHLFQGGTLMPFAKGGVIAPDGGLGEVVRAFAKGGAFSARGLNGPVEMTQARVRPFARGGVVAAPTYFPLGTASFGLMGEKGAEAIMPLTRGADGSLGVRQVDGGGRAQVTVNVATPDLAAFRRSDAYLSGLVSRAVTRAQRSA